MTRREWLVDHYPERVMDRFGGTIAYPLYGGCLGCPWQYEELSDMEKLCDHTRNCEICWTREVPVTGEAETAEIISDLKDID